MGLGINRFGLGTQGFWQFWWNCEGNTSKITDDVGAVLPSPPLSFLKNSKAIRESDFYRDSEAIGMGSEIIGPIAPRSSEKGTVFIGLH